MKTNDASDSAPGPNRAENNIGNESTPSNAEVVSTRIEVIDYDPRWPEMFSQRAQSIRAAIGERALGIEHMGSTSVPGLAAKPVIDVLLVVADSAKEEDYAEPLESAGYFLKIREPEWFEHRMFKGANPETNLHVFSIGCEEIDRVLAFRDWLRNSPEDRALYTSVKQSLAQRDWKCVQDYADAKTTVVKEILARAGMLEEE